jgi:hypothetical protein
MAGNANNYEGILDLQQIAAGWIEGTRRGLSIQDIRTPGSSDRRSYHLNLNEEMEFDHVIYSFGDGRIADVVGLWAPVAHQYQDEHGEWLDPELEEFQGNQPWSLMNGYSGQDRYSGPWMHQSEFVGGGMARDILATPGFFVTIYPSMIAESKDDNTEPDTWAVAYISENIPGSMPEKA